jgi:hypothetical protein
MDLQKHLARQLAFLEHSCQLYDQGARDEAIRIATVARVLFHHTHPKTRRNGSRSLLAQLGATNVRLVSTCYRPTGRGWFGNFQSNLTDMVTLLGPDTTFESTPRLELDKHRVPEDARIVPSPTWWDGEIIYAFMSDGQPIELSRKDLICIAANQDGGAHVDPELDRRYQALERGAGWTFRDAVDPIEPVPLANAHLAALRQIGFEILHSPELTALQTVEHSPDSPLLP